MKLTYYTILILLLCQIQTVFAQAILTGELKTWHKITLTFDGPNTSETATPNPFADYNLAVTFTNGSKTYTVPGYYAADGNAEESSATSGDKWRVHFAPDTIGTWNYSVAFTTGTDVAVNGGGTSAGFMDSETGSFVVTATDKNGRDLRGKGRLKYVGEHYLQFQETDEWFVKAGADAPENTLAYEDFDDVPNRGNRRKSWSPHAQDYNASEASSYTWQNGKGSELLGAIAYLSGKGMNAFSFLTFSLAGDDENVFPHLLKVPISTYNTYGDANQWDLGVHHDRFDVSRMVQWEKVFEYADLKGIYLHFKTQETENDGKMDGGAVDRERKLYYRELVARFGHHLALNWNMGEENVQTEQQRKDMAAYFEQIDPYQHNRVIHTYPGQKNSVYTPLLGNQSEYTGASLQTSNSTYNEVFSDVLSWVEQSETQGKKWIVAVDEPGNASIGVNSDPDDRKLVRHKVVWATLMAGGAGVEFYYGYQSGCGDLQCEDHRTRDEKYTDAAFALDFFQTHFQQYLPDAINQNSITSNSNDYVFGKTDEAYAIYLPNGGSTNITLPAGDWIVRWYNPRDGVLQTTETTVDGSITAPDSNDWVALITSNSCTQNILFIRGGTGTGGFLEGGTDDQLSDITDFSTSSPNRGWGEFATALENEGYQLTQLIESPNIPIDLTSLDLAQYECIVFGSNNATYSTASIDSLESYVRLGGGALFISDANWGSNWGDAPSSEQGFLDRFGWTMNQDQGTYAINSSDFLDPNHPIFIGVTSFDGEGVSPITLSDPNITGVTSTILANAKNVVRRNTGMNAGPSQTPTVNDAALIIATVDQGRIAGHFDRNTFFNLNGAGTNINRLSNKQYALNLINWLTNCEPPACQPSTACDDGDDCTTGNVFDTNCNCVGTFQDSDNDGICDSEDQCAGFDDNLDADMDGTPDGCDTCDNTTDGTPCDDSNPDTSNDVITDCVCAGVPVNQTNVWLEAECAEVGSEWTKTFDVNAANDTFLLPPSTTAFDNAPSNPEDRVRFHFQVSDAGSYKVYARTRTTGGNDDSFWVRANGGTWQKWNRVNSPDYSTNFQWDQVGNWTSGHNAVPVTFNLTVGENTVDFAWREPNARLDKIYVTLTGLEPTGFGATASNCGDCNDTDMDGICDAQDQCPGFDDNLDADSDGLPDGCDTCDNTTDGTACDDGDPMTINDILTNCVCAGTPMPSGDTDFWLEAECAEVGSEWTSTFDINASNDTFLLSPNSTSTGSAPTDLEDYVRFRFAVSEAGAYKVYARTIVVQNGNSLWVRANGGTWQRWNNINGVPPYNTVYEWDQVGNWTSQTGTTPVNFNLSVGENIVDMAWREPGVKLDKIFVTLDSGEPLGQGADTINCPYCFEDTDQDGICNPDDICEGFSDLPLLITADPTIDSTYRAVDSIFGNVTIANNLDITFKAGRVIT
ncbi:MAG: DUF5060 domain-containing protein, partial [Bacteroidota bacterium]